MLQKIIVGHIISLVLFFGLITAAHANTDYTSPATAYNSAVIYPGQFEPNLVYHKNRFNDDWVRGLNGTFPTAISCVTARQALELAGYWRGGLRLNGTCFKSDEPLDWATGNRLNFNMLK